MTAGQLTIDSKVNENDITSMIEIFTILII